MTAGTASADDVVVRYDVTVSGRVQGVWYRESCRRVAEEAGVSGWVRNNHDGSVAAAVEGPPAAVVRVLAWMREGPRRAVVSGFEAKEALPEGAHGFVVR